MGRTVYKVKLQVVRPGILHSVSGIWIILVTVFLCLTLYILIVGLMVSFHRKQKHRTHTERISRIMGSLFRPRPEMDVPFSEEKDSGTELSRTVVRDASCSTNYENLGSRENISPGDRRSLSEHLNPETDAAQSYENLCEDGDEDDDDDYLDPAGEDGSINTEGQHSERLNGPSVYAIPNKASKMDQASTDGGLRVSSWDTEGIPHQFEETSGDSSSSEEDYAVPDAETPVALMMDTNGTYTNQSEQRRGTMGGREHSLDQEGDTDRTLGNDDYMKMCAARNVSQRDMLPHAGGSSAEESVMMERCRKLFMKKFQSNASRYSSQDEAGGSVKTLPREKNPHAAAFSTMDRMATLPE
ncbi:uncharacterized protein LOC132813581 [Hemiscyllium ocellatum]|uniref:uncharacterized protein LOC132813581 n=1 Tax=Hemiscyllium ocellatum TaxID=170820 RepID=UPI0029670819|nr:uncharacterized protein LOC132813581 [Hemiscyllium ocellatum]